MRPSPLAVALLVLALLPHGVAAQGTAALPAPLQVASDAAGDEGLSAGGAGTPVSRWAATDLQALTLSEDAQGYHVLLKVRALGTESAPLADSIFYEMRFKAKDTPYGIRIFYDASAGTADAYLEAPDPEFGGFYRSVATLSATVQAEAGTFDVLVPHDVLLGSDGAALFVGDQLTGFWVDAEAEGGLFVDAYTLGTAKFYDRMPDSDEGPGAWTVSVGPELHGPLAVRSPSPVRVSNGEATTVLFEVEAKNLSDHLDTYRLKANGAPSTWVVTFPQQETRVEAGAVQTLPVLATVPFAHIHGAFFHFNVTVQSMSDPLTYGVVQLGIRYTTVPQPAGHHDTVFLHGAGQQYINTLETDDIPQDERSGGLPGGGGCYSGDGTDSGITRLIPLFPDFDLGVDMDMARNGTANVVLHSDVPVQGTYSVGGHFLVWYGHERPNTCALDPPAQAIAKLERSAPLTIAARSDQLVKLAIQPLAYGDRLPRTPDIHLALVLVLFQEGVGQVPVCCFSEQAPTFVNGSSFQLPLNEYHDPVSGYFSTLSGIDLRAVTDQQRLVNPGKSAVFKVQAENIGQSDGTFDLEVTGSHLDWARILGDSKVSLPAGGQRELAVAVTPDSGAPDGEVIDITLHAVNHADSNVRSLIRLLATVDTEAEQPDDSALAQGLDDSLHSKDSPGLVAPIAIAGLLALALLARRRR